jgi:hypothetical protein
MLKMPFGRHNGCDEIFQLVLVRDQLCKKMPQVPFKQHFADIKDRSGYFGHAYQLFAGGILSRLRRKKTAHE